MNSLEQINQNNSYLQFQNNSYLMFANTAGGQMQFEQQGLQNQYGHYQVASQIFNTNRTDCYQMSSLHQPSIYQNNQMQNCNNQIYNSNQSNQQFQQNQQSSQFQQQQFNSQQQYQINQQIHNQQNHCNSNNHDQDWSDDDSEFNPQDVIESEEDEEIRKEDIEYDELNKPDYLDDPNFNLNDYLAKRHNL